MITKKEYMKLDDAYIYFNKALFKNKLPDCLITYQRSRKARGYFSPARFVCRGGENEISEIALNIGCFDDRADIDILSTLVHEMCHLLQFYFGKPSRGGYHNREWFASMMDIGLEPTGLGQKVSHDIIDGKFKDSAELFLNKGFKFDWNSFEVSGLKLKAKSKTKYTCDGCGLNIWAKPNIRVMCVDCNEELEEN